MTAEIGILNKSAVALAADSAVTIQTRNGQKIYNTVNKLFCLNKHHPVGIMVYGNADLNDVPWETLIKLYRSSLGNKSFRTITDYAADFFRFLSKDSSGILAAGESSYFGRVATAYLNSIRRSFLRKVDDEIEKHGTIKKARASSILAEILQKERKRRQKAPRLKLFAGITAAKVVNPYRSAIKNAAGIAFEKFPLNKHHLDQLYVILGTLFVRNLFEVSMSSGVVIAGFGSDQHYPQLISFTVEGYIMRRLKYKKSNSALITNEHSAAIIPFAQSEMVIAFMEGIDPKLKDVIDRYLKEILTDLPMAIVDRIKAAGGSVPAKIRSGLSKTTNQILTKISEALESYRKENHWQPVMDITDVLPKDELAATAEALVNLTSFRRRVTLDAETVGGPIDVAVISKGDGFIWIKRKHYFKAELNPSFFVNR